MLHGYKENWSVVIVRRGGKQSPVSTSSRNFSDYQKLRSNKTYSEKYPGSSFKNYYEESTISQTTQYNFSSTEYKSRVIRDILVIILQEKSIAVLELLSLVE